ncbi:MAG: potassium-transporting ATPase subunit KdpA [Arsenophonus sp. NC-PE1-MAG3]
MLNPKVHNFSKVLYKFYLTVNNNSSTFAGLNRNTYSIKLC